MRDIKVTFPMGCTKALTLSYDDGVESDKRLIEILNKYNLKSTFNLNSGIKGGSSWSSNGIDIVRMELKDNIELYKGHEVAVHTLTHKDLTKLNRDEIKKEVLEDRFNLEKIYNYPIRGMAYPYGTYNEEVLSVLDEIGISYARTVEYTEMFNIPDDFLKWKPTCRHANPKLMEIAEKFLNSNSDNMQLFYLWGHSYEFDINDNWGIIEEFSKYISRRSDMWYATNIEIYEYIKAVKSLVIEEDIIYNGSNEDVWIILDGNKKIIKAGELLKK